MITVWKHCALKGKNGGGGYGEEYADNESDLAVFLNQRLKSNEGRLGKISKSMY